MDAEKLRSGRDKLTRVFRYLEALNQHRNPAKRQIREQLWNLWLHDLPDHPSIKRGGTKSRTSKVAGAENPNGQTARASVVPKVQPPASTTPYFFSAFNYSSTLRYPNSRSRKPTIRPSFTLPCSNR